MRKIVGYTVSIADPTRGEFIKDVVMDAIAQDPRWELAGGLLCVVSDSGGGKLVPVMMQALVMYEETKEPPDASSSGIGMAKWSGVGDDPRGRVRDFLVTGLCTRGPGHTGSCNGFWREQCGQFKALP